MDLKVDLLNRLKEYDWVLTPNNDLNILNVFKSVISLVRGYKPILKVFRNYQNIDKIIFIYLDGLGYEVFKESMKETMNIYPIEITSIYPATTSAIVTSFATSKYPSIHGVLEWNLYLPEINMLIEVLPMKPYRKRCNDVLCESGVKPSNIIKSRRIYRSLSKEGVNIKAYLRGYISHSCYTKYILDGVEINPYINITDLSVILKNDLSKDPGRSLYYVYIEGMDSIAHLHGYGREEYIMDIKYTIKILFESLSRLDKNILRNTLIVLTSDHGLTNIPKENMIFLDKINRKIKKYIKKDVNNIYLVSGSPRNVYLHIYYEYIDKVYKILESISDKAIIVEREELINSKLMKDIRKNIINRIGEIILFPTPNNGIWIHHYPGETVKTIGFHGGISIDEMKIPLIVERISRIL